MPCCYNLCGRCGVGLDFLPFCSLHSVIKRGVNKHLGSKGVLRNSSPHWSKYKPWDGARDSGRSLLVFLGHLWWSISHFSGCWDLTPDINNAKEGGFNLVYSFSPLWQEALVQQTGLHYGREEGQRLVGLGWGAAEGWGKTEHAYANWLSPFSSSILSALPIYGMAPHTLREDLP